MAARLTRAAALGLALLLAGGCAPARAPAPVDAAAAVARALDDWHDAAARSDEARYFAHFAPGGVFLGTDATERWSVEAFRGYAHAAFAQGKGWVMVPARRAVTIDPGGRVAWFDEELATRNLGPARGSGVLVLDGATGAWRIAQYNLALTIPNGRLPEIKRRLEGP